MRRLTGDAPVRHEVGQHREHFLELCRCHDLPLVPTKSFQQLAERHHCPVALAALLEMHGGAHRGGELRHLPQAAQTLQFGQTVGFDGQLEFTLLYL